MEITTSPHRPAPTPWWRLVALVVVLGPVSVLALLPTGLGLDRYVLSSDSMDGPGGISRGTVLLERQVPVDDLEVGDVITFHPPPSSGEDRMVTHRVVALGDGGIITKGDAEPEPDPWVLRPQDPTVGRVDFTVPVVGYAYLILLRPATVTLLVLSAAAVSLLLATELNRRRRRVSARARLQAIGKVYQQ
jgi:signal peptidase I